MQLSFLQHHLPKRVLAAGLALFALAGLALADPPGRVARLGYISGEVSFSPAGEEEWDRAAINRPLGPGDRLWADADGRAEIQLGTATLRLNGSTAVSVLNLDDQITQLQLTEGSMHVRVRRLEADEFVEVDTPHLAFTLRQPGAYRIDVDPNGEATTIKLRDGEGEVTGEGVSVLMQAPQVQRFTGDALRDDRYDAAPQPDEFDRWAGERDRSWDASVSARYVSPDVVGYQDLDDNGNWSVEASYGNVWYPRRVSTGWAPYRDGHWAWIDPWGWTWVDDAPWGYAVSHYGRWAHIRGRWGWVPGPVRTRAYYAPALVAFVGGDNFRLKISIGGGGGGIGWFPLGPREVYRPAYKVSERYFERVNVSNTVVNKTVIKNVYVTKNVTNITYVNRRVPGAFVAVPQDTFRNAQPVAKAVVKVDRRVIEGRETAPAAAVAPTARAVRGVNVGAQAAGRPPAKAFARQVVARTEPPPPRLGFAAQQQKLTAQPGRPLDDDERRQLRTAAPTAAAAASAARPAVKVIAKRPAEAQTLPARAARASEPREAAAPPRRGASDPERRTARGDGAAPAGAAATASSPARRPARPADAGSAPAPTRANAAERRASAAEARAERARSRDGSAASDAAPAPQGNAKQAARAERAERAARAASAAEARRQQRPAAPDAAPAPRNRPAQPGTAEPAAPRAPREGATAPVTPDERAARRAERAARRGEDPASAPRGRRGDQQ
jgi:hypothetical protein